MPVVANVADWATDTTDVYCLGQKSENKVLATWVPLEAEWETPATDLSLLGCSCLHFASSSFYVYQYVQFVLPIRMLVILD